LRLIERTTQRVPLECMMLEQSGRARTQQPTTGLTRQQRLDLAKLVAAGIVSAILFATPVLLSRETAPGIASKKAPATLPTRPTAAAATMSSVVVVTKEIAAPISTPTLQPSGVASATVRRSGSGRRARYALAASRPRLPLGRRIVRLVAGDGSHTVRPFPTVASAAR
jgi:hypothetical protein